MDEQLHPELNTEPKPTAVDETKKEEKVGSVFNFESMIRSEREVNAYASSVTSAEAVVAQAAEDKVFSKKTDEKKRLYKRRVKIATGVYTTIVGMLLLFTIVNIVSLIITSRAINTDTKTIQANNEKIVQLEEKAAEAKTTEDTIPVTLNLPRDYSKEKTELTFLDKVTIIIKNIFG